MAARIKAFGLSYAALVGTVPSGPSGPSITTDPSAANEESDPSGAVQNGYAYLSSYQQSSASSRPGGTLIVTSPSSSPAARLIAARAGSARTASCEVWRCSVCGGGQSESRVDSNTMKRLFCPVETLVSKKASSSLVIMITMLKLR